MPLITLAIALFLGAAFMLFHVRRWRELGGLPKGKMVSADDVSEATIVLISRRYGLKGKPDAIVRTPAGELIPVERKAARAPRRPYDGDLMQASAYCLLIEEEYGEAPPFMRIQYADRWFDEPYTPSRKEWVLQTCERLRRARCLSDCNRSHNVAAKCRHCGQRQNCDQALQPR
jgi:CRISPR-associated exonuclease Cas4